MKFVETPLTGAYIIELEPFQDERGSFARMFCREEFRKIGFQKQIAQINHSMTRKAATIRGLHYQCPPAAEAKIIRCIRGKVFDVMVDIRKGSPGFLQFHGLELSPESLFMVYIPEGFAHGFQALTDNAELLYLHSALYTPQCELGLRFNDPALRIDWPLPVGAVSLRDQSYPLINVDFKGIDR